MEEKKEPIKIRLSTVILIFIIFILVIAMLAMYIFYNKKDDKQIVEKANIEKKIADNEEHNTEVVNNQTKQETNIITSEEKEIDINSDIIQKLNKYILKFRADDEKIVYQSKKITSENMENKLKLATIFNNLTEKDASEVIENTDEQKQEIFKKEIVEKKAKEIFGDNVSIIHENCTYNLAENIIYENGVYKRSQFQGGGGTAWETSSNMLIKAEQVGNEIYIYDKYVHIIENLENSTFDIYTASDRTVKIKENVNFVTSGVYDGLDNLSNEEYNKQFFKNLKKICENKIKTFKHTFKKNSDGSYYWYSTEPIE